MEIKLRLRVLLAEHNLKQKDLAKMTGLSTRLISDLVNNKLKQLPIDALDRIATELNIKDVRELFVLLEGEEK